MAVGISRDTRVQSFVIEKATPYISNQLKLNDAIVAIFGANNRIKIQNGGDLFNERMMYGQNSNVGWTGKLSQIPTAQQNNWLTAKYGQANLTGSIVINQIEENQNEGDFAISDMLTAMVENAVQTVITTVADGLRAAAPGATEPNSVVALIEQTAFGSQTSTTGNLSRATYATWWQNQYNNDGADLSSNAGIKKLEQVYWQDCAKGAGLREQPDFGLTRGTYFASLSAYGDSLRQFSGDSKLRQLGFDAIKVLNMSVMADPSMPSGTFYMLNTNYLRLQVLRSPSMKQYGENPDTIPLTMGELVKDIDSLNKVQLFYITMNLTTNSLRHQGVLGTVT